MSITLYRRENTNISKSFFDDEKKDIRQNCSTIFECDFLKNQARQNTKDYTIIHERKIIGTATVTDVKNKTISISFKSTSKEYKNTNFKINLKNGILTNNAGNKLKTLTLKAIMKKHTDGTVSSPLISFSTFKKNYINSKFIGFVFSCSFKEHIYFSNTSSSGTEFENFVIGSVTVADLKKFSYLGKNNIRGKPVALIINGNPSNQTDATNKTDAGNLTTGAERLATGTERLATGTERLATGTERLVRKYVNMNRINELAKPKIRN